jgi:hypothetical protein
LAFSIHLGYLRTLFNPDVPDEKENHMKEEITKEDAGQFHFQEYRKVGTTELSDEILPVGTRVQTLEGLYVCAESSRLAIDVHGNIYPVAESIFERSYELAYPITLD